MKKALGIALALAITASARAETTEAPWPPQDDPETLTYARVLEVYWTAPTKRMSGAPLSPEELSHYELIVKDANGQHAYTIPANETTADHLVSTEGEHCAVMRAIDADDRAGPWIAPVCDTLGSGPGRVTLTLGGRS